MMLMEDFFAFYPYLSNRGKGLKIQGKARLVIDPHKLKTSWQLGVDSSTFGALHRSRRGQGSNFPLGLNIWGVSHSCLSSDKMRWLKSFINYVFNREWPNSHTKKMSVNDKRSHQSLSTANTLNIYFCDIGSELASILPKTIASHRYKSYLKNYRHELKFSAICELEVFIYLDQLDVW